MLNRSSGVEFNGRSWRRAATLSWAIGLLCLLANSAFAQFNIQYDGKWVGQLQCAGVVKEVRANIRRSDFVMLHFMEGGLEILRGEVSDKGIVELIGKPDDAHAGEWKAKFTGKFSLAQSFCAYKI